MPSLAEHANAIVNIPQVLALSAPGYARVDLSAFFAKPENFAVGDGDGLVLFAYQSPGVFEGHYLFRPTADRRKVLQVCREALAAAFTLHRASAIVGHTPADNLPARAVTRALGFTRQGTSVSSTGRSCVDYILERDTWAILSGASLVA